MKCAVDRGKILRDGPFVKLSVYNSDNKRVGRSDASVLSTDKRFIWVHEIKVIPECRRKGIGEKLLEGIKEVGQSGNAELIYVFPGTPDDEKMPISQQKIEHFYKKNGFKPCNAPKDVATITYEGLAKRGMCLKLKKK